MSDEIQQTRYDRMVRRVTGIIGPGSKVAQVITELFPMINVEDPPPELLLLGGTIPSFGGGTITGAAGEAPRAQLFNPANSGRLVTLTDVYFATLATTTVRWGVTTPAIGVTITTQTSLDTRLFTPARPTAQIRQTSSAALASATGQTRLLADTPLHLHNANGVAILRPGTGFEIGISLLTGIIHYTFYWRERDAEASELNL